jgi:hypothetical protein
MLAGSDGEEEDEGTGGLLQEEEEDEGTGGLLQEEEDTAVPPLLPMFDDCMTLHTT